MLRRLQIPLYRLREIYVSLPLLDVEELKLLFGPKPYEFNYEIENNFTFANKFGSYRKEIDPQKELKHLYNNKKLQFIKEDLKKLIHEDDIGKFIDKKNREYIGGHEKEEFTVRLPRGKNNIRDGTLFPEVGETIELDRRGIKKKAKITDTGKPRKATILVKIKYVQDI